MGSWSFCLAKLADWRNDIAGDGITANDGPPVNGGVKTGHAAAQKSATMARA